mmetsp:Transcript_23823/g.33366  ORF Transcript_23823/g.33366 Transcript_23823/m.33366 type:complete len:283 (+) Transcript_23823:85-933(+)|eukprot:CAMPEP_0184486178 /NCGR_PEP_ID=MMETSP0113_2-20130426/7715_1 /TAXON_ID=91329 /ORGANISM="Norrisiella sphaerica, Strain BC52" /LENGTH=282 /DNA_ID=CAMNT_0026867935 /DNA_START=70 /DNA_END=918 /DNA_ORIENTATION=+
MSEGNKPLVGNVKENGGFGYDGMDQEKTVLEMDVEGGDAKVYGDRKHENVWTELYLAFANVDIDRKGLVDRSEFYPRAMKLEELFRESVSINELNWEMADDLSLPDFLASAMPNEKEKHDLFLMAYEIALKIDEQLDGQFNRSKVIDTIKENNPDLKALLANAGKLEDLGMGSQTMKFNELWDVIIAAKAAEDNKSKEIPKDKRTTTRYLTKYERARVLGTRALQISLGAPVLVDIQGETDPLQIATRELKEKKIPIIIRRYLPSGMYEDWSIDDPELIVTQ